MNFLPDVYVLCEVCNGRRYNQETLSVKFNGYSIADMLDLPIEDALPVLKDIPAVNQKLQTLVDVGLGYMHLGQSATTLSGGEAQRMKLANELSKRQTGQTLYLLDEPTTGLHFDDVRRLLEVLHRLTDLGNTVIIIEHNLDIIRNADYVMDLGPEGGEGGGRIVAQGTPEVVAHNEESHTGRFLARYYEGAEKGSAGVALPPAQLPDLARKAPKVRRAAPEKKTGVPTPSKKKPEANGGERNRQEKTGEDGQHGARIGFRALAGRKYEPFDDIRGRCTEGAGHPARYRSRAGSRSGQTHSAHRPRAAVLHHRVAESESLRACGAGGGTPPYRGADQGAPGAGDAGPGCVVCADACSGVGALSRGCGTARSRGASSGTRWQRSAGGTGS